MPVLLTFGDSNTHGTPPIVDRDTYARFGPDQRWPGVALTALGPAWTLIEEGLPGRTTCFDDPVMGAHMNGQQGLRMALQSHGPIDVLTLMLGTNDSKAHFGASPETIMGGMAGLLAIALSKDMQTRHGGFKVLVISPPPVRVLGPIATEFYRGDVKSRALPALYSDLAKHWGVGFMDAGAHIAVSPVDGVHFDLAAHRILGAAAAATLVQLMAAKA